MLWLEKTLNVDILHLFTSILSVFNTQQQLTHPIPDTNRPLAPSSWPLIGPVARGNPNRNRCCLADLPYDPNDIWTRFSAVGGPLCLHFTSVVCICFYFRYKDLIIPTLGDKKKLSPEEKCRSVLQQTKLQGWQVCACVVCFPSYSAQINPTDLPNALIPDPPHKSFRGICDYSFQLSYLIIILIREHTHINPAPLSLLSGTLLLCLGVWPYRSQQLPSHTRTHTPPQWQADAYSYRLLYITHTYSPIPTSTMCWNDCFLQPMLAPR